MLELLMRIKAIVHFILGMNIFYFENSTALLSPYLSGTFKVLMHEIFIVHF
jgi:hypothetical protein